MEQKIYNKTALTSSIERKKNELYTFEGINKN